MQRVAVGRAGDGDTRSDLFQVLVIAVGVVALLAVFRDLTAVQCTQVAAIAVGLLMRQVQAPRGSPAACRLHRSEITFFPYGLLLLCSILHRRNAMGIC